MQDYDNLIQRKKEEKEEGLEKIQQLDNMVRMELESLIDAFKKISPRKRNDTISTTSDEYKGWRITTSGIKNIKKFPQTQQWATVNVAYDIVNKCFKVWATQTKNTFDEGGSYMTNTNSTRYITPPNQKDLRNTLMKLFDETYAWWQTYC